MSAIANVLDVLKLEVEDLWNLIGNPSAEVDASEWVSSALSLTRDTTLGPAFKMVTAAGSGAETGYAYPNQGAGFVVTGPGVYTFEVEVQGDGTSYAQMYSNPAGSQFVISPVIPLAAGWRKLTITGTAPAGTTSIYPVIRQASAGAHTLRFRRARLTLAGATTNPQRNLVPNPTAELGPWGWSKTSGNDVLTSDVSAGQPRFAFSAGTSRFGQLVNAKVIDVVPGDWISAAWNEAQSTGAFAYFAGGNLSFRNALGAFVGAASTGTGATLHGDPAGARKYIDPVQVPAGAVTAILTFRAYATAAGTGSFPSGIVFRWWNVTLACGPTSASVTNLVPRTLVGYVPITAAAVACNIVRRDFDSTLTATLRDATLDPSVSTTLLPGGKCRVMALSGTGWEPIWSGAIVVPQVDYGNLKANRKGSGRPTITLTGTGPGVLLVAAKSVYAYKKLANARYILEYAPGQFGGSDPVAIPYNLNGSAPDQPVPGGGYGGANGQATALDQLIVTRDGANGYAWIDRRGTLQLLSDRTADPYPNGLVTLAEFNYTGLGYGFDVRSCINVVTITRLERGPAPDYEPVEVTYGPYEDGKSKRKWGPQPAEFRVILEACPDPAAFAALILAANATPQKQVTSLRLPIRDTGDIIDAQALIDLYQSVQVLNDELGINVTQRVLGVDHQIDSGGRGHSARWYVDVTFATDGAIAVPQVTSSLPTNTASADAAEGVWVEVGSGGTAPAFANAWVNYGAGWGTAAFMKKNGVVYLKGLIRAGALGTSAFTLPAGYRPAQQELFTGISAVSKAASAGTAHTHADVGARIEVYPTGAVLLNVGGNGAVSLAGISYPAEA